MNAPAAAPAPSWLREFESALAVSSHILMTGNVRDNYLVPGSPGDAVRPRGLIDALWGPLSAAGFEAIVVADPATGMRAHPDDRRGTVSDTVGAAFREGVLSHTHVEQAARAVAGNTRRLAFVVENASHLVRDTATLAPEEHRLFAAVDGLAVTTGSRVHDGDVVGLYNVCVWICQGERDLPAFFAAQNEMVRQIPVPLPDLSDRAAYARLLTLSGDREGADEATLEQAIATYAGATDGLPLRAMAEIRRLAGRSGLGLAELPEAVRRYRVGVSDNPWRRPELRRNLLEAEERLSRRVKGQSAAIRRAVDVILRSHLGLTAAHTSGGGGRPRGILFFAGPTGVGKTELAKAVAELIFGDESAYTRFDMSEFSAEHADARLIGAPPGYVGFGGGGELTNAVRERPFSLILFDEVEKAHPRILDKFLQVLEDGRLTDGAGATVHFSESVLVFTSNVGLTRPDEDNPGRRVPNVDPSMPPDVMEELMRKELDRFFREDLNRPELLNRLGDNIVVFRFIGEEVGREILELGLGRVRDRVRRELDMELVLEERAAAALTEYCLGDLSLGGRGIGARLERALVNPLARALFVASPVAGSTVRVHDAHMDDGEWTLELGAS